MRPVRGSLRRGILLGTAILAGLLLAGLWAPPGAAGTTPNAAGELAPSVAPAVPPTGTYAVEFDSVGLPAGSTWNLTVAGRTWTTTNATLTIYEPDGTYAYTATATGAAGPETLAANFIVSGAPRSVTLSWNGAASSGPSSVPAAGTSAGVGYVGWLAAVAVGAVVAVAALGLARRARAAERADAPPSLPGAAGGAGDAPPPDAAPSEPEDPLAHML